MIETNNDKVMSYLENRAMLLSHEFERTLGHNLSLTPMEEIANQVIMEAKVKEIDQHFLDPAKFPPAQSFGEAFSEIRQSPLYDLIRTMPKGGILHAHDTALGSARIMVDLTYRKFCWICFHMDGSFEFIFSLTQPVNDFCDEWQLMEDYRRNGGMSDAELSKYFMLKTTRNYTDENDVWKEFDHIFYIVYRLVGYRPNFEEYIARTLQELLDDGVQYVELRTSLREVSFLFVFM